MIMASGARGYVTRNADPDNPGVEDIHPCTLRGLRDALLDAEIKSNFGQPKVIVRIFDGESKVVGRFENARRPPA
jgi:hypothetical protein